MTETLRPAVPEDFPALLALQIACIHSLEGKSTYKHQELSDWVSYLEREGSDRYGRFINRVIVDDQEDIKAFVSWSEDRLQHTAAIECLYANEADRGQGFGTVLLQTAEVSVVPGTTIGVRSTVNARSFYERQGYSYIGDAKSRAGFTIALLEKHLHNR